jgi:serine protease inhibitor
MKHILPILLLAFGVMACYPEETIPLPNPSPAILLNCNYSPTLCELNEANNQFGFDIFRRLHEEEPEKNIFISPMSIGAAMAMTTNGAAGQTRLDMEAAMNLETIGMEDANAAYQTLLHVLPEMDPDVTAQLANSIWYREGVSVVPDFLETTDTYYESETQELDFSDPAAKDIINGWVKDNTNGLIEEIISDIPGNAVMFLINAIYFKGAWKQEFDPERTAPTPFFQSDGSQVQVDMMHNGGLWLPYFETEDFHAVDLAYGDSIFSMTVLLPKEDVAINTLVNQLETSAWNDWVSSFHIDSVYFAMPKFEMEYDKMLNDVLIDLGMQRAFDGGAADFSNLIQGGGVWIDKVKHKSFIEVDEKGTEAAAVTSVSVITSAPVIPIVAMNRPFLFVIRENQSNSILFIGKMMNPTKK